MRRLIVAVKMTPRAPRPPPFTHTLPYDQRTLYPSSYFSYRTSYRTPTPRRPKLESGDMIAIRIMTACNPSPGLEPTPVHPEKQAEPKGWAVGVFEYARPQHSNSLVWNMVHTQDVEGCHFTSTPLQQASGRSPWAQVKLVSSAMTELPIFQHAMTSTHELDRFCYIGSR